MPPTRSGFIVSRMAMFLAAVCLIGSAAQAADKSGARDHPSLTRFKGSEITDYQVADFDEAVLPVKPIVEDGAAPRDAVLTVEGKVTSIGYRIPAHKSGLEVMRNYEQALAGYKTIFKCTGDDCGRNFAGYVGGSGKVVPSGWSATFNAAKNRYLLAQRADPAGDNYALIYVMEENDSQPVTVFEKVVEVKPMQGAQVTALDAASMKRTLEADGKVVIYGVLFDTAKAEIKPESQPSLAEMAKLLGAQSALSVYIVGHTDNAGTMAANLDLSQRRAEAVVSALAMTYKIDKRRMVARGVASLAPVWTNTSEAGRAKNRRVELVVQ